MTIENGFFEKMLERSAAADKLLKETCIKNGWEVNENRLLEERIDNFEKKETNDIPSKEIKESDKKKKAFLLFAGLRKKTEDKTEEQQKKEDSSQATVAYQQVVANNYNGNTGVTATFSTASDFKTPEERIGELYNQLAMESDRNKILCIISQIANLVPDKERFMKTLLSKLK